MADSSTNPAEVIPSTSSPTPEDQPKVEIIKPRRERCIFTKTQRARADMCRDKLARLWYAGWLNSQRMAYLRAFVDATVCCSMALTLLYTHLIAFLVKHLDSESGAEVTLFQFHACWQIVVAVVIGFAFGSLFKTIGDWKEYRAISPSGKTKRYVVFGQLRLPLWLYFCITFVTSFTLSFMASGGLKFVFSTRKDGQLDWLQVNWIWCGVVTVICAACIIGVAVDAILRHKIMGRQQGVTVFDTKTDQSGTLIQQEGTVRRSCGLLCVSELQLLAPARHPQHLHSLALAGWEERNFRAAHSHMSSFPLVPSQSPVSIEDTFASRLHITRHHDPEARAILQTKMATEDARYRTSTQYRLWSFTPAQLSTLRSDSNSLATTAISARLQSSVPPVDPLPEFLTPTEESALLTFYTVELLRAAAFLELPTEIRATSAIFLRRFYVTNSIMTYPPTELLKTCLFFGCKAEGYYMRLSKFADKFPNTSAEVVLAAEYVLCQGIRFAFDVKHPFRALEGTMMEIRRLGDFETSRIDRGHARAREILKFSPIVTDAYFHYTPSQIMLAALAMADEGLAQRLLRDAFAGQGEAAQEQVWNVIQSCRELLEKEPPERMAAHWSSQDTSKAMKPLVKKLKKCRDPDRVDLVALQKARREQADKKKPKPALKDDAGVFGGALGEPDAKRRKTATNGDDPFGPALG